MIAFPSYLIGIGDQVGMKVPDDIENTKEGMDKIKNEFPHFFVFCQLQIGIAIEPDWPYQNAKLITKFSDEAVKEATWVDYFVPGFRVKNSLDLTPESIADSRARLIKWGVLEAETN